MDIIKPIMTSNDIKIISRPIDKQKSLEHRFCVNFIEDIEPNIQSELILEPTTDFIGNNYTYHLIPTNDDIYANYFSSQDHTIFIVKDEPLFFVIYKLINSLHGCIISKYRTLEFTINHDKSCINDRQIIKLLRKYFLPHAKIYSLIPNDNLIADLVQFNKTLAFSVNLMNIGIIYCKDKQTQLSQMFTNKYRDSSNAYRSFLVTLDVTDDIFENNIKIRWYLSSHMTDQDIRQYIANLNCLIIYKDGMEPFDFNVLANFGKLAQIFIIVRSTANNFYRLDVVYKKMKQFSPNIPSIESNTVQLKYLFTADNIRDFILYKLHNGLVSLKEDSLISYYYLYPREQALKDLVIKYD